MKKAWIIILIASIVLIVGALLIWNPFSTEKETKADAVQLAGEQYEKGLVYYESGDFEAAEACFAKAVTLRSSHSGALIKLVESRLELGRINSAREALENLRNRFPDLAETVLLEGRILLLEDNYDPALLRFSEAIERNASLAQAWFYRGLAYEKTGQFDPAIADYLRAYGIDSSLTVSALGKAAEIYHRLTRYDDAIALYSKLIGSDSTQVWAFLKRASSILSSGDPVSAMLDYNRVITLDPANGEAYLNRGICHAQLGRFDQAISDSKKAAECGYKTASAWYNAAKSALEMRKIDEAAGYLRNIPDSPEDPDMVIRANNLLGNIYMEKHNYSKAIDCFTKSISQNDSLPLAYFNRGISYEQLGDHSRALSDLQRSKSLGYDSPDLYCGIGVQLLHLQRNDEACQNLRKAVEMGHKQAEVLLWRHCSN